MADFTLDSMAHFLLNLGNAMPMAEQSALEEAADIILEEVKAEIGHYQPAAGPFAAWAQLKPETIAQKANGDTPLLETGETRDSYGKVILAGEAHVGSDVDTAVWQELGTAKGIPPRAALGGSAVRKSAEVKEAIGRHMHGALIKPETAFANGARREINIP